MKFQADHQGQTRVESFGQMAHYMQEPTRVGKQAKRAFPY